MKEVLLKGNNVSKMFVQGGQGTQVLHGVDVETYKGDFTVIMGTSGAGKSTLLYALSGMDQLSEGAVFYQGEEISRFSEKQMAALRAKEFGFVFQQMYLVSNLTLFENVAVAGYISESGNAQEILERTEQLLKQMGVADARRRLPSQVSGGEAQRAAIARAMVGQPGILFADEPTGALNRANTEEVLNLLSSLHEQGQSILMVTHDIRAAVRANRLLYMEDGRILDEMKLPGFTKEDMRNRETKITQWLSALQW